jgi:hypothetical protein
MRELPFSSPPLISWPRDFFSWKFDGLYAIALVGVFVFSVVFAWGIS